MSNIAPVLLANPDAAGNLTFSPVTIDAAGVAKYADRSDGPAIGFPVITLSMRQPSKGSRNYRVVGKVVYPVLDSAAIVPTKAFDMLGTFEFVIPDRANVQQRSAIQSLVGSFLVSPVVESMVCDLEPVY